MELIKNTINTYDTTAKGTAQVMTEGDVIVPDIKPDILKLLQVDSDAIITDKYTENGKLIILGRVNYKILYVPDRENVKIESMNTSMDFKQTIDTKNPNADVTVLANPIVERVEFNTVNSRKLHLRAIVHIDYEAYTIIVRELSVDTDDENAEKKIDKISFENIVNISEHEFTVKERLQIPSGENSISEILKTDVKIYDTECKSVTGKVITKGELGICILYIDSDGEIKFTECECPFTEVFDTDDVTDSCVCDIDYILLNVQSIAEPDIDGDLREISLDIDINASFKATNNIDNDILLDCFVPKMTSECSSEKIFLKSTVERPSVQNTIREMIELPDNIPSISEIYNVMTNAVITKSELNKDKIICEGKIEAYILYLTDSGENPIYSFKKDIPFSYMIECNNDTSEMVCGIKADIKHSSYNLNSKGELELRCLLSIECVLTKSYEINNITDVIVSENNNKHGILICFASKGESVWDISKRYGVVCENLTKLNNLECDTLEENCKLFIPVN